MKTTLAGLAFVFGLASHGLAAETLEQIRQQARGVCMMDVMMLCASSIPDEASIMKCMGARRPQLSAPCREVFDAGLRASRRRQQSMR